MAITELTDLMTFTESAEIVTGGDFTGSNDDPPNAWWDANGGNADFGYDIQNNKGQCRNPNATGTCYIGRADIGGSYLSSDGPRVPFLAQADFTVNANPEGASIWHAMLQLWSDTSNQFSPMLGHMDNTGAPGDWDTYGYGIYSNKNNVFDDPNNPNIITESSDTTGKLRAEMVPYKDRDDNWWVECRAAYWNGSSWTIMNPNKPYAEYPDGLDNVGMYLNSRNEIGGVTTLPIDWDNASAKTITDHSWGKDEDRIGIGYFFDYGNGLIRCGNTDGDFNAQFWYDDLYADGVSYTTNITVENYVSGECRVWHGQNLLGTITEDGSYEFVGVCDYDGGNNYDELWLTSTLEVNDFEVTALTTAPTPLGGMAITSINGVSTASIAKINGVEIANIASRNGVSF
jgi:hypothetical protein